MVSGQLVYDKNWVSKLSEAIKEQNEAMLADEDYEVANLFYEGRPQNGIYAVRSMGVDPSTGRESSRPRWKPDDHLEGGRQGLPGTGLPTTAVTSVRC